MDDLVRHRNFHYIEFSDTLAYILSKTKVLTDLRSMSPVVAFQIPYNLNRRYPEQELIQMAIEEDIGIAARGLLAGVFLTEYTGVGVRTSGTSV